MPDLSLGPFAFDPAAGRLTRDGTPVPLGGRALAVLTALARAEGTVSKEALLEAAWPGVIVEEGNLTVQVATLRKLLGEDVIVTVPRVGYRLRRADAPPSGAGLPRLAVLPFETIGGGAEDQYFADGLAEDLITSLGRFRQFAVLSRPAALAVRHDPAAAGIRYQLEGSLRRAGDRLRIAARLTEVGSGLHLWSRSFDGADGDIFAFQDRITEAVATAVAPEIEAAEIAAVRRERSTSPAAYDLFLRALPEIHSESEPGNARARALLDHALALEPDNPLYLAHAAWVIEHRCTMGWEPFGADDPARCIAFARRALALASGDARVLIHAAVSLMHLRDYDLSVGAAQRALAENPNNSYVLLGAAVVNLHLGDLGQVRVLAERSLALSPNDPMRHIQSSLLAAYHVLSGSPEQAVGHARAGLAAQPNFDPLYWMMVAALMALGRTAEAGNYVTELRALAPGTTVARIRAGQPALKPERIEPILAALEAAGLPVG